MDIYVYVSPNGQGQADSEKNPFSPEGACDLVRTHNQTVGSDIHVY